MLTHKTSSVPDLGPDNDVCLSESVHQVSLKIQRFQVSDILYSCILAFKIDQNLVQVILCYCNNKEVIDICI